MTCLLCHLLLVILWHLKSLVLRGLNDPGLTLPLCWYVSGRVQSIYVWIIVWSIYLDCVLLHCDLLLKLENYLF